MTAAWAPSQLRQYIRDRWPAAGVPRALAWVIGQQAAGMTVAVYECAIIAADGHCLSLLLPADHAEPPADLPAAGGTVAWPFRLIAVSYPEETNVVPLRQAADGRR